MQCGIQLLRVAGNSLLFFKCLVHAFQEISCTISSLCLFTSQHPPPMIFSRTDRGALGREKVVCVTDSSILPPRTGHLGQGEQEQNRAPCQNYRPLFLSPFLSEPAIFPFFAVWVIMLQLSDLPMHGPLLRYKKSAYNSLYIKKHVAPASVNGFVYLPTNLYCLKCNLKLCREIGSSYN